MKKGTLIYDQDCPLCVWYTNLFIQLGILNPNERLPYFQAIQDKSLKFNHDLAQNKIAFVRSSNDEAVYGIDSLLAVLGSRWKWIEIVGNLPGINSLLKLLYLLISYNRKVIAPVNCDNAIACTPTKNWFWRITFIGLIALFLNFSVTHYFTVHLNSYFIGNHFYGDLLYFSFQFAFQGVFFYLLKQRNFYDYIGQIAFVSFLGALLLGFFDLGLLFLQSWGFETELLVGVCYGIVYMFMIIVHARRIKILGFSGWLTVSWIVYRLLLYPIAFKFF
jgi:predicted DCC family thiol-disulfide oxidoreductase YuxK